MLRVYYIKKSDEHLYKNLVSMNDKWFNDNKSVLAMDSADISSIRDIDHVELDNKHKLYFRSRFRPGTLASVEELSTGCKTAINVNNFRDHIFSIKESGLNAIERIFKNGEGNIYDDQYINTPLSAKFPFIIVCGGVEYTINSKKEGVLLSIHIREVYLK